MTRQAGGEVMHDDARTPLLSVVDVSKRFPIERGLTRRARGELVAVDGVSLSIWPGSTVGLVGESGSGKSTLGRLVLRLIDPTAGQVLFKNRDLTQIKGRELARVRRDLQIVFQDPHSAFDPASSLMASMREPMQTHLSLASRDQQDRAGELFDMVGLSPALLHRFPGELSGGQLQRAAIARALTLEPQLLVLDEPVSSLDVSTQAQVVNLLQELQDRLGLAYLFIAHDLAVVRHVSHRIAVMYLGRIVEEGPAESVYHSPRHPYTEALLSAIPTPDPLRQRTRRRIVLKGDIPSPVNPPRGCHFHTRCPHVMDICREVDPAPFSVATDSTVVYCHLHTSGPTLCGEPVTSIRAPQPS